MHNPLLDHVERGRSRGFTTDWRSDWNTARWSNVVAIVVRVARVREIERALLVFKRGWGQ